MSDEEWRGAGPGDGAAGGGLGLRGARRGTADFHPSKLLPVGLGRRQGIYRQNQPSPSPLPPCPAGETQTPQTRPCPARPRDSSTSPMPARDPAGVQRLTEPSHEAPLALGPASVCSAPAAPAVRLSRCPPAG
eukprot:767646-Hanusia_phi.AAC.6